MKAWWGSFILTALGIGLFFGAFFPEAFRLVSNQPDIDFVLSLPSSFLPGSPHHLSAYAFQKGTRRPASGLRLTFAVKRPGGEDEPFMEGVFREGREGHYVGIMDMPEKLPDRLCRLELRTAQDPDRILAGAPINIPHSLLLAVVPPEHRLHGGESFLFRLAALDAVTGAPEANVPIRCKMISSSNLHWINRVVKTSRTGVGDFKGFLHPLFQAGRVRFEFSAGCNRVSLGFSVFPALTGADKIREIFSGIATRLFPPIFFNRLPELGSQAGQWLPDAQASNLDRDIQVKVADRTITLPPLKKVFPKGAFLEVWSRNRLFFSGFVPGSDAQAMVTTNHSLPRAFPAKILLWWPTRKGVKRREIIVPAVAHDPARKVFHRMAELSASSPGAVLKRLYEPLPQNIFQISSKIDGRKAVFNSKLLLGIAWIALFVLVAIGRMMGGPTMGGRAYFLAVLFWPAVLFWVCLGFGWKGRALFGLGLLTCSFARKLLHRNLGTLPSGLIWSDFFNVWTGYIALLLLFASTDDILGVSFEGVQPQFMGLWGAILSLCLFFLVFRTRSNPVDRSPADRVLPFSEQITGLFDRLLSSFSTSSWFGAMAQIVVLLLIFSAFFKVSAFRWADVTEPLERERPGTYRLARSMVRSSQEHQEKIFVGTVGSGDSTLAQEKSPVIDSFKNYQKTGFVPSFGSRHQFVLFRKNTEVTGNQPSAVRIYVHYQDFLRRLIELRIHAHNTAASLFQEAIARVERFPLLVGQERENEILFLESLVPPMAEIFFWQRENQAEGTEGTRHLVKSFFRSYSKCLFLDQAILEASKAGDFDQSDDLVNLRDWFGVQVTENLEEMSESGFLNRKRLLDIFSGGGKFVLSGPRGKMNCSFLLMNETLDLARGISFPKDFEVKKLEVVRNDPVLVEIRR